MIMGVAMEDARDVARVAADTPRQRAREITWRSVKHVRLERTAADSDVRAAEAAWRRRGSIAASSKRWSSLWKEYVCGNRGRHARLQANASDRARRPRRVWVVAGSNEGLFYLVICLERSTIPSRSTAMAVILPGLERS